MRRLALTTPLTTLLLAATLTTACSDPLEPALGPMTFELKNEAASAAWLQNNAWFTIKNASGDALTIDRGCTCACDDYSCEPCAEDEPIPGVAELAVGASKKFTWDAISWRFKQSSSKTCAESATARNGQKFSVELCWGSGKDDSRAPQVYVEGKTCKSVDLVPGKTVSISITDADLPPVFQPATFGLDNQSGAGVWIDSTTDSSWYTIKDSSGASIVLNGGCWLCDCANPSCEPCLAAAPAPAVAELSTGMSKKLTFDGNYWAMNTEKNCADRKRAQAGDAFTAEVCWGSGGDMNMQLLDRQCETLDLKQGEEVLHTLPAPEM